MKIVLSAIEMKPVYRVMRINTLVINVKLYVVHVQEANVILMELVLLVHLIFVLMKKNGEMLVMLIVITNIQNVKNVLKLMENVSSAMKDFMELIVIKNVVIALIKNVILEESV